MKRFFKSGKEYGFDWVGCEDGLCVTLCESAEIVKEMELEDEFGTKDIQIVINTPHENTPESVREFLEDNSDYFTEETLKAALSAIDEAIEEYSDIDEDCYEQYEVIDEADKIFRNKYAEKATEKTLYDVMCTPLLLEAIENFAEYAEELGMTVEEN